MSGGGSIVPNLQSSAMLSVAATLVTLVLAIPAAYALARLRMPAKKPVGFYVLARQMLPPIRACDPVFSNLQPVQPAQHLFRADRGLRVVLAALRDLADGFFFRGDSPRDGRGGTDRPRHPAQGAVACDPAAGPRRHLGNARGCISQRMERGSVRGRARRAQRAAGDGRHVQLHLARTDAMGPRLRRGADRDG